MRPLPASLILSLGIAACDNNIGKTSENVAPSITPSVTASASSSARPPPAHDRACRDLCLRMGQCRGVHNKCVADSVAACLRSEGCRDAGRCSLLVDECVVAGDDDCASAKICLKDKACKARHGECVKSCADSQRLCQEQGRCGERADRCVATDNAMCRASVGCKQDGRCVALAGHCVAASNDDCRASSWCASHRRCVAEGGRCVTEASDAGLGE